MGTSNLHPAAQFRVALLVFVLLIGSMTDAKTMSSVDASAIRLVLLQTPVSAVERRAARIVTQGLHTLYNANVEIQEHDTLTFISDNQPKLLLGANAAVAAEAIHSAEIAQCAPGGHVMRVGNGLVAIAGADPWATLYGSYAFLNELGLVHYGRRQTEVKQNADPVLAPRLIVDRPALAFRSGREQAMYEMFHEIADPRRAAAPGLFGKGSDMWIDHSAGYLVPKNLYYDTHPEYYAMLADGKRIAKDAFTDHRTPLCMSNPDVVNVSKTRALDWVERDMDARFFMITNGDGGWCQCQACNALDHAPHQHAGRLFSWANPIANAVAENFPDRHCVTFAYGGSDIPPPNLSVAPNLWVCASTGLGNLPFWDHHVRQRSTAWKNNVAKLEKWLPLVPNRFLVCEYQGHYEPALIDTLKARLLWYSTRGIQGILFRYGRPTNFPELWQYLFGRLMWNPHLEPYPLAHDFIRHRYGAASPHLIQLFAHYHQRYQDTLRHQLDGNYPASFYTDAFAEHCLVLFERAQAVVDDERKQELLEEEKRFVGDWMLHPPEHVLNDARQAALTKQLDRLLALTGNTEPERMALARVLHASGVKLDSRLNGARSAVETWLAQKQFPQPRGQQEGERVVLPANLFMYAGFGPEEYTGTLIPVPAETVVAVYVKGNSMGRSDRMEVTFDVTDLHGDNGATLEFYGTDCDHDVPASAIRVEVNDQAVFDGQVLVVKHMWSRQSFTIPAGVLRKGPNTLRVTNVVDPSTVEKWYQRWFMLARATIDLTP